MATDHSSRHVAHSTDGGDWAGGRPPPLLYQPKFHELLWRVGRPDILASPSFLPFSKCSYSSTSINEEVIISLFANFVAFTKKIPEALSFIAWDTPRDHFYRGNPRDIYQATVVNEAWKRCSLDFEKTLHAEMDEDIAIGIISRKLIIFSLSNGFEVSTHPLAAITKPSHPFPDNRAAVVAAEWSRGKVVRCLYCQISSRHYKNFQEVGGSNVTPRRFDGGCTYRTSLQ